MKIKVFLIITGLLALAGAAYFTMNESTPRAPAKTNKRRIVASFYPLYYFASQISGDRAEVYNITPAGAEPHDYEPTPQDMARIEDANLLILNGGNFEAWGKRVRDGRRGAGVAVVAVGEALAGQKTSDGDSVAINDPHVWLSPALAKKEAEKIADSIKLIDPAGAGYYEANAADLARRLAALDRDFRDGLSRCADRNIITSHAAFGYLAREYGIMQTPISGLSPDEEPTALKLAEIADFVKKNQIKYIFFESLVNPKLAQTIAEETGAEALPLNPLEGLTAEEEAGGQDYFTVMSENLATLQTALRCK